MELYKYRKNIKSNVDKGTSSNEVAEKVPTAHIADV